VRRAGLVRWGAVPALFWLGGTVAVAAQEMVPAAYTPAPYGLNLLTLTTTYSSGDLAFDPSAPISEADAKITSSAAGYTRTLKVAGRSANLGIFVPYVLGDIEGLYLGEPAAAERSGPGDLAIRAAVNLLGAPAMSPREFAAYRPRTLLGASLEIRAPIGEYDSSKLINIGTNRWSFKPEVGVVRVMGRWAVDAYLGAWLYTDNPDFFGGLTREQDPILSTQAHLRYAFGPRAWGALDGSFWRGGQTTIGGRVSDDEQKNSRIGVTLSLSLAPGHSLRIAVSRGAFTRIGGDFDSLGVSYNCTWLGRQSLG
jgi:hypothetical protein